MKKNNKIMNFKNINIIWTGELPHLCECGKCNKITKEGNRFIHGHNLFIRSPQWFLHVAEANRRPEKRMKSTLKNSGDNNPSKRPEVRAKISKNKLLFYSNLENRKKQSVIGLAVWDRPGEKEKRCNIQQVVQKRPETNKKRSLSMEKKWQDPEYKERVIESLRTSEALKIAHDNPEFKKGQSDKTKELWKNSEYREKQILAIGKGLKLQPNKPETFLMNLLDNLYPGEWKFVGDYSFIINGKNPDFKHNTQNKLIELYGTYWHKGQNVEDRKFIFREKGYETLILWEHELSDMDFVLFQLEEFMKISRKNQEILL